LDQRGWLAMARAIRIQYPGAVYHLMARGNQGQAIFADDLNREAWLRTLGQVVQPNGVGALQPSHPRDQVGVGRLEPPDGKIDGSGAQGIANTINGPVAWYKSEGIIIDVIGEVWKIATFGLLDTAGRQFAQLADQQGANTVVMAHSGGAASAVFDALLGRFNDNVTLIGSSRT
jgi:hypothetical protein